MIVNPCKTMIVKSKMILNPNFDHKPMKKKIVNLNKSKSKL